MTKKTLIKKKNILYTGHGDDGTTTLYKCDQGRISKSTNIIEALGSLDELNAYIGIVKVYANEEYLKIPFGKDKISYSDIINEIQQTLFIIQAEMAGSDMTVNKNMVNKIEKIIEEIGKILPPITSFTLSGGSVISAELDYSRTLARRAERKIIAVLDEKFKKIGIQTTSYLNRLSSLLFAMSRYSNHLLSISEEHPNYNKK